MTASINDFDGISIEHEHLLKLVMEGVSVASAAAAALPHGAGREFSHIDFAAVSALQTVNSLLAAASAQCTLAPPPPVNIDMVTDATGALILRCRHASQHRWKLDGTKI
ncbi:MAG: hypothetical protein WBB34_22620 [Xanthobacteraceae bacterium]